MKVLSKRNNKLEYRVGEFLEKVNREKKVKMAVPENSVADEKEEAWIPDP